MSFLTDVSTMSTITVVAIIAALMFTIAKNLHISPLRVLSNFTTWIMSIFSKKVRQKERNYRRDVEIGKIDEKRRRVKTYRFLSELIIDLGWKDTGLMPYEFLYLMIIGSAIVDIIVCKIVFGSFITAIFMYPMFTIGVLCFLYTKANVAHDARIEAVIDSENMICNGMKSSVVTAVEECLDVLPKEVRNDYRDFVDDVKQKNTYIKTALLDLNRKLGSVSDDFIKKCINFELEEEHGMVGIFTEIVEMNNIKREEKVRVKNAIEDKILEVKICVGMIYVFLAGVLIIYPSVRHIYFNTVFGHILIGVDALLMIVIYVILTWIKAQDM